MKKILLSLSIAFVFVSSSIAQDNKNTNELKVQLKGTYQIQILDHTRQQLSLKDDIYDVIEKKRDAEKIVYYKVSKDIRVLILPSETINSKDFEPIAEQKIVHKF